MNVTHITSTSNAAVKNANALKQKKYRDEQNLFAVEGLKMLREAVSAGMNIMQIFVLDEIYSENKAFFDNIDTEEIYITNNAVIEKISDWKTPQGIVSIISRKNYDINGILSKDSVFAVILDGVSDPGNVGTIIRTAEAAGVDAVITTGSAADCFQPKALRASMGSIFRVPVFENLEKCDIIYKIKSHGIRIVSTSLSGENMFGCDISKNKNALVFGNEAAGISKEFRENSDLLVKLPMEGKVESLNVAVSAGIIMYSVKRPI